MMMSCREVYGFLDDFLGGELEAVVRLKFEAHLLICAKCRAYLATYRSAIETARGVEALEERLGGDPPEELIQAILASRGAETPEPLPE
jgi:anti-sigma factor RsiW